MNSSPITRSRLRLCIHGYVCEYAFSHLYCLTTALSARECLDLNCYGGAPHLNDFGVAAHLVSDKDGALKAAIA